MIAFDHAKLAARDFAEVKRFRDFVTSVAEGDHARATILHDDDGHCCRAERWEQTESGWSRRSARGWSGGSPT